MFTQRQRDLLVEYLRCKIEEQDVTIDFQYSHRQALTQKTNVLFNEILQEERASWKFLTGWMPEGMTADQYFTASQCRCHLHVLGYDFDRVEVSHLRRVTYGGILPL